MVQKKEIDRDRMPKDWPTDRFPPEFWEEYGRTVGAFGFLEDTLKRAHMAITGSVPQAYQSEEQAKAALADWERDLEKSMNEALGALTVRLVKVLKEDDRYSTRHSDAIDRALRRVSEWRNKLCHGAWVNYSQGTATLRSWRKEEWRQRTERDLSINDLLEVRHMTIQAIYDIVDTVTSRGIQLPGAPE